MKGAGPAAMIGGVHTTRTQALRTRASVPAIGPWVPTATVHVVFLAVAAGLCVLVLKDFWLVGGLLLAVTGTFIPKLVPRWWVISLLGVSQLWREQSVHDVAFYLLLAGAHLLYVIDSLAREMRWHGRAQTVAFVKPFQRFVLVQTVLQAVAVSALFAFDGRRGTVPGLSIFAATVLGVVAAVFARALRRRVLL